MPVTRTPLKVLQLTDTGINPVLSWWQVAPVTELDHGFTGICQACLKTHWYPWKALFWYLSWMFWFCCKLKPSVLVLPSGHGEQLTALTVMKTCVLEDSCRAWFPQAKQIQFFQPQRYDICYSSLNFPPFCQNFHGIVTKMEHNHHR